ESEAYKTYLAYATCEKIPKPKYGKNKVDSKSSPKKKTATTAKGKRLKTSAKAAKPAKKKQLAKTSKAKGLIVLSEVALTEAEQIKLATKRSLIETHSSHTSGSGADEGTGSKPGVPDAPTYGSDDEKISWKSNNDDQEDDEDQDDVNEQTDSDNDGVNVEEEELDEEETNDEDEANELYMDVNVNLEGRDIEMTDAQQTNVQTTQVIEDTYVIITPVNLEGQHQSSSMSFGFVSNMLNPNLDTGIDSMFNLNTESTSLIDVPVTTIAEPPLLSTTTLPLPPTPLITHLQQTPVPTPATVPRSSLQDLPNFGSLFGFDHRLKTLENDFSEFKQTNQFVTAVSSILGIVDTYLANKMNEAVKTAVQLQSDRLRDESQSKNEDFLNKLDDNIKKIIKDQVKEQVKAQVSKILPKIKKTVNKQLEAEVLTRSSNESKTSHAVVANLSELELKKILIDKMESNNSFDTYGDNVSFKRRRDDEDKDEEPSAGSNQGSKRRRAGKEPESTSAPKEKTSKTIGKSNEGLNLIIKDPRESFNELIDTPLDFLAFVMNMLKVNTLTPELLAGPTFELMKGSCKSLVELEYFFEEVYKATTDQLDWNNPKGQQYPHDLRKPLPLIPNSQVMNTKAADHGNIKWIEDLVPNTMWSQVPSQWHQLQASIWITIRRYDDKLYKFKEGDFNRLHIQDIEYMLLLLVQGKLTNLTVEEHLAFNVSLRMFTRSIVIQRRVDDLQLGVESYQKKLNLTKPDTYRSDLNEGKLIQAILQSQRFHLPKQRQEEQIDAY
ncbi:hypothetical protein Tco_0226133, partial [Tanacetum coccineum]